MKSVQIYTDGACKGNPGPGGYGAVLLYKTYRRELSGGFRHTTNNRMEIFAAIAAVELLNEPCEITLYSDSSYLVNAVTKRWLYNWKRSGWVKRDGQPVNNMVWVKGHADNVENSRCDALAVAAAARRNALPPDTGFR